MFIRQDSCSLGRNKWVVVQNISTSPTFIPFTVGETSGPGDRGTRHWIRRTNLVDSRTSVTDVKFGPKSQGLQLATSSAEGIIRIYEAPDVMNLTQWTLQHEVPCKLPCSSLSWNSTLSK